MSEYDDTNRGALFKNDRKEPGSKQPDYTGKINVAGKEWALSAWLRKSKTGKSFMSIAVSKPRTKDDQAEGRDHISSNQAGMDGDIPF